VFWVAFLIGVVMSSLAVWGAVQLVDPEAQPVVGAADFLGAAIVGYGFVRVARFFFLDRYLFWVVEPVGSSGDLDSDVSSELA